MRYIRNGQILLVVVLSVGIAAWGQGRNGRGAAAQQQQTAAQAAAQTATPPAGAPGAATAAAAAGRGGRNGGGAAAANGPNEFFDFDTTAGSEPPIPDGPPAETHQKIALGGETLAYTAHAGYMPLRNATSGQSEAHIFYTSYSKDGVSDASSRPVIVFLGGAPGVASAWQEFGGLGPKRMKWASDGTSGMAPYLWVDNPNTLLGQADLVFVNPVGTGFSRPDQPSRGPTFWNTSADIASLAAFVRGYINTNNRRNSPLILAGEDAGTGRASGLATYLIEHGIPVQGVALFSMTQSADATAGDTQYITLLPSLTMAAWNHKKLSPEMNAMSAEQIAGEASKFASREYLHALYKGDRITPEERTKVIADLSRMTGLSKPFLANNELRVTLDRFNAEIMREQHHGLSVSDARVSGFVPSAGGGGRGGGGGGGGFGGFAANPIDFNLSNLTGGFQTAYEDYVRRELAFSGPGNAIYYLNSGGVGAFTSTGNDDASLSGAFARNPRLRLFVGVNYYDLSAPFYATEYTLAHLNVSPEARSHNITVSHYEAGQMTYVDNKALVKLKNDLASFVNQAASPAQK
jgi:carboxypeptidase C (cathepsin A)